jgi:membrane-bound lytic murein transglycosylase
MTGSKVNSFLRSSAVLFAFAAAALISGCSKKTVEQPTASVAGSSKKEAHDDPAIAKDLQAVQQDLSAKEFERATAAMMRMQDMAPAMSEKDALRMQGQMRNLQTTLSQAAASGDPKAQNAIAMLRMMSRENQMPMRR